MYLGHWPSCVGVFVADVLRSSIFFADRCFFSCFWNFHSSLQKLNPIWLVHILEMGWFHHQLVVFGRLKLCFVGKNFETSWHLGPVRAVQTQPRPRPRWHLAKQRSDIFFEMTVRRREMGWKWSLWVTKRSFWRMAEESTYERVLGCCSINPVWLNILSLQKNTFQNTATTKRSRRCLRSMEMSMLGIDLGWSHFETCPSSRANCFIQGTWWIVPTCSSKRENGG